MSKHPELASPVLATNLLRNRFYYLDFISTLPSGSDNNSVRGIDVNGHRWYPFCQSRQILCDTLACATITTPVDSPRSIIEIEKPTFSCANCPKRRRSKTFIQS